MIKNTIVQMYFAFGISTDQITPFALKLTFEPKIIGVKINIRTQAHFETKQRKLFNGASSFKNKTKENKRNRFSHGN